MTQVIGKQIHRIYRETVIIQVIDKQTHRIYRETCYYTCYR